MKKQNPFPESIFKAYDIRGIYPEEIDENLIYTIGRAYTQLLQDEEQKHELTLVVSSDMRVSSPKLKQQVIEGITDQGAHVVDIGLSSTPTFYFAVAHYQYDGGLIITASHNPKEYNGCKMVRKHAIPISEKTGILNMKELVRQETFKHNKKGKVKNKQLKY